MVEKKIWRPISYDTAWEQCDTSKFDDLAPSWYKKRQQIDKDDIDYNEFITRLKRSHAIETGIIEKLYDLSDGITQTFIKEGFVESYIGHDDTNIPPQKLMAYLHDHYEGIDFIFDFVKQNRPLSKDYIKRLHALITRNQDTCQAIDQFGNHIQVGLLKGDFKKNENNPRRTDGTVYIYCPPVHVDSEMERLIDFYTNLENRKTNPIIISAWFHHAFTQIHPFQDGNGGVARLLASLILVKAGLFPFTVNRKERSKYLSALEDADVNQPKALVDYFSEQQKGNIERFLNKETDKTPANMSEAAKLFTLKIQENHKKTKEQRQKVLLQNRSFVFDFIYSLFGEIKIELFNFIPKEISEIKLQSVKPGDSEDYWYTQQIVEYAKEHDYYFNKFLPRGWFRFSFCLTDEKKYDLVLTVHHYSYEDDVIAIGCFLEFYEKDCPESSTNHINSTTYIPIKMGPYTISLEKIENESRLKANIEAYVRDIVTIGLTTITNEIV